MSTPLHERPALRRGREGAPVAAPPDGVPLVGRRSGPRLPPHPSEAGDTGRDAPGRTSPARVRADGKFLRIGGDRFFVKGVTYGTFAPDENGERFPPTATVARDFQAMAALGLNTVRLYTPPRPELLDLAAEHGLRAMVGIPWTQHVAFLDDRKLARSIRREVVAAVRALAAHPTAFLFALGNEIPPGVVRWHGRRRVERFLASLYRDARDAAPDALFTYANFPPTEYLDLSCFDVLAFNVYLHREAELRAYLARLQNVAGERPLLLAEAGADSLREGLGGQADITSTHIRAAFEEGAAGAIAFAWTDEWWRGGGAVDDWAFGLVDRERRPKPAAFAVQRAFADAPFPEAERARWPRVSVVVCAYNAAATLEDCLASLERVDYPDYEIVVVDDGSRDETAAIAERHAAVRLVRTPNRGLSSARNAGLAAAQGEVVAFADADVRVDPDWLSYLVQPLLASAEVVGSGGPNVVPPDDPRLAQCVARAPGGPTHVLLDDRTAEHVPGCNMAFRRDALLAIGGFDPIYLRAGDDVDICWRLQARGGRIGFAPAALVWHHHRASIRAFWRQQVGYGEGEAWLLAHHPEKFLDGRMLWRGRIYSPLPFVRSLSGTRVNAGVWGTAAFPSVYRTDVHPLGFLPHSLAWQALSLLVLLLGIAAVLVGAGAGWALLAAGAAGLLTTLARNLVYALRTDVRALPGSPLVNRGLIAFLHFVQPLARAWGRLRGTLVPPEMAGPRVSVRGGGGPGPGPVDAARALRLVWGGVVEDRFWNERWTSAERVLAGVARVLAETRAVRSVAVDDGWSEDRDLSVPVGRWGWIDLRALVEEHEGGRCLVRFATSLRLTPVGVAAVAGAGSVAAAGVALSAALGSPLVSGAAALLALGTGVYGWARTARSAAAIGRAVREVAADGAMTRLPVEPGPTPLPVPPRRRAWALRAAAGVVLAAFGLGAGSFVAQGGVRAEIVAGGAGRAGPALSVWLETPGGIAVAPDGDIYLADAYSGVVRRIQAQTLLVTPFAGSQDRGSGFSGDGGPAIAAMLHEPDGVAVAPDGDLIIADSQNHRIRRVDAATGVITTIAGSGEAGWDGDGRPALETAFHQPSAVACAPNGDIYIADTMNNRIRVLEARTGRVRTVAGDGRVVEAGAVGDGGPATAAHLYMPSDVVLGPDGDLWIADLHHNRVRRVDLASGVITTVAGDGSFGNAPDGTPALSASLAGPAGIALVPDGGAPDGALTLFIADSYNGLVRRVGPDGVLRTVARGSDVAFGAPSRLAYAPARGWLYVADALENRVVALALRDPPDRAALDTLPVPMPSTAGEPRP